MIKPATKAVVGFVMETFPHANVLMRDGPD
jgi:hypothetical protein